MAEVRVIKLNESVYSKNDNQADMTRRMLNDKKVFFVNIMSSPGSGKTTMLSRLINMLKDDYRIGEMDVDIESDIDARRVAESTGVKTMQIHNGGLCHIDAKMTADAISEYGVDDLDILFLENIGNLVCPAEFDTGAHRNVMILSVPEGDDKPLKYPLMFSVCNVVLVNKIDTLKAFDFDMQKFTNHVKELNPNAIIMPISAKTGEGMEEWADWLKKETAAWKEEETRMKKFEYTPPEQPRELILKLGQKITDRIGHTVTAEDPEYYGLEALVMDEMAEVALKMKVRKPMTLAQVVKATGKEEKVLEELLQEMSNIGLLEYNWENPKHEKQYVLPMYVPGSAEFFNMKLDQIKEHPEVASFFERMAFLPLQKVTPMVPPGGAGIGMHVIPVEKAIETENESVSVEHISHWLDKYDGKYAAGPCSCRYSRGVLGEGCADDPEDWCIGVGDMADYLVETNKGHYITREKVMEILQRAEDNGFVHQITNIDGEDKIFAICNCNVNICNALRTSQLFNTPNMSRSAYVAKVETKDCVACGRCVEYCPAGAVKMGQKLCTKDGTITYPKHELPDNTKWDRKNGIWITVITTASTVMIPERHRVRRHVRHISQYRDT